MGTTGVMSGLRLSGGGFGHYRRDEWVKEGGFGHYRRDEWVKVVRRIWALQA